MILIKRNYLHINEANHKKGDHLNKFKFFFQINSEMNSINMTKSKQTNSQLHTTTFLEKMFIHM